MDIKPTWDRHGHGHGHGYEHQHRHGWNMNIIRIVNMKQNMYKVCEHDHVLSNLYVHEDNIYNKFNLINMCNFNEYKF
jgi:hypothetical protein